ncbi:MAG: hemin-degrading factor [Cyclobacteriaceae bacterium]|nr:hemin-degrading factor [Cyclobacteriaceae bacterium]MCH8515899.1 hemin-degrading factor [Cyclobacteriaceae bacterium]
MENTIAPKQSPKELKASYSEWKSKNPKGRIRDAAQALAISEAELIASELGDTVVRLASEKRHDLLLAFKKLGKVMCLTRSESCVLEHKGSFQQIEIMGEGDRSMATVIGPIELRVFFSGWKHLFAVKHTGINGKRLLSFQIFDQAGTAVMKVYLQKDEQEKIFNEIIETLKDKDQETLPVVSDYEKPHPHSNPETVAFQEGWLQMKDTHDFFGLVRKFGLTRKQALEIAPEGMSIRISLEKLEQVLTLASQRALPIMVFAGNKGNIQIHQGKVKNIKMMGPWLNVLDPQFNMHLNLSSIASAWLVKKPTEDGVVTSIEIFDREDELGAQFFGLRKPGIPERGGWRELLSEVYGISIED